MESPGVCVAGVTFIGVTLAVTTLEPKSEPCGEKLRLSAVDIATEVTGRDCLICHGGLGRAYGFLSVSTSHDFAVGVRHRPQSP